VRYLLDTNIVSENTKPRPNQDVTDWLDSISDEDLYISVLVVGELVQGIERLRRRDPGRASVHQRGLDSLMEQYGPRILPITAEVAAEWGKMGVPDPVPMVDGLMAATAKVHGLTFVTRNIGDVARTGVRLLNPFSS
jgi:toxin FitB